MTNMGDWVAQRYATDWQAEMYRQAEHDRIVREIVDITRPQTAFYASKAVRHPVIMTLALVIRQFLHLR
jgi:hypothetical protein